MHMRNVRSFLNWFSFAGHLRKFQDVFTFPLDNPSNGVTLHKSLRTPDDRTTAVGEVIKSLGELIPGIRNEVLFGLTG